MEGEGEGEGEVTIPIDQPHIRWPMQQYVLKWVSLHQN